MVALERDAGESGAARAEQLWRDLIRLAGQDPNNDPGYARFVTKWPLRHYTNRLKQIGFTQKDSVLDLGCGYGQWSIGLSQANKQVTACDQHRGILSVASELFEIAQLDNVECVQARAEQLPFEDESFDAVFCYGVFMFLDPKQSIDELSRVLRPGGVLYLCTNGPGWWISLFVKNVFRNRIVANASFQALKNGTERVPLSTSCRQLARMFECKGWEVLATGSEGTIGNTSRCPEPVYREMRFLDNVIEGIFRKG